MSEISDGQLYKANDLVKCGCNDCAGCSDCCHGMSDTIILDPYDIFNLTKGLNRTFSELLSDEVIELHFVDGVLLPNLKMGPNDACSFLNDSGRCSIHSFRPGFCRLFPLGRIYDEDSFSYFLQVHECPHENKTKVKVKKWLDIPALPKYEQFILTWHRHLKDFGEELSHADPGDVAKLTTTFLKHYFEKPYDVEGDFYEEFYARLL